MFKKGILTFVMLFTTVGFTNETSQELTPLAHINNYESTGYNDVWGYTAPDGREYALLGVKNGTSILDITDVNNVTEVTFIESANSIWKDIKTYQHYAYVVNESRGGMQIIDLSKLPNEASVVATYTNFQNSHNLYIDTERGILFAEGNHMQPVRVLSLANPTAPVQISSLGVECHDIMGQDNLLYVSEGGHGTIGVWNYEDATNPVLVTRFGIPNSGYVHNAWLSEDGKTLMTTEETNNKTMKVWDVSDLNNVTLLSEYLAPNGLAHNTHIKGNYAYVSHYGGGLRIIDLSDRRRPKEVAYHAKDKSLPKGFVGAWGAFPFFASGKVLLSDIEAGLYIYQFDPGKEE